MTLTNKPDIAEEKEAKEEVQWQLDLPCPRPEYKLEITNDGNAK